MMFYGNQTKNNLCEKSASFGFSLSVYMIKFQIFVWKGLKMLLPSENLGSFQFKNRGKWPSYEQQSCVHVKAAAQCEKMHRNCSTVSFHRTRNT